MKEERRRDANGVGKDAGRRRRREGGAGGLLRFQSVGGLVHQLLEKNVGNK